MNLFSSTTDYNMQVSNEDKNSDGPNFGVPEFNAPI